MDRSLWRDIWEQPNLLKDLTLLSMLKKEGPMTTYKAAIIVRGSGGGGYCSPIKSYFNGLIKRKLVSSENKPVKTGKRIVYSITLEGEEFLNQKKQQIVSL